MTKTMFDPKVHGYKDGLWTCEHICWPEHGVTSGSQPAIDPCPWCEIERLRAALAGTANEPSGGLPIRHPGDEMKIYSCPFDSFMPIAFRPGWIIKRMWKEGEKLCFIAGPAEAPSPERTSGE